MHDGWETRRRRGEGHDWVVIRLATETEIERIEVDTSNFKGNYPDTLLARGSCDVPTSPPTRRPSRHGPRSCSHRKLGPHRRFAFPIDPPVPATQVRLNIHPDGGVARLRVHGRVTDDGWRAFGVRWLNAKTPEVFEERVLACCGSRAWASGLAGGAAVRDVRRAAADRRRRVGRTLGRGPAGGVRGAPADRGARRVGLGSGRAGRRRRQRATRPCARSRPATTSTRSGSGTCS